MGEFVAAAFILMFIFGLLTFGVYFLLGFFVSGLRDTKLALGLLAFAGSGATGFAATWRFMVLSARTEAQTDATPVPPPGEALDDLTSEERSFRDRTGYLPMQSNEGTDRWGPLR
jgi:hypothetical protein